MASKPTARQEARPRQPLPDIPDKLYYRIGEVARLCGVETYVLRFWETEFSQLKPNKSGAGQRLYRRREVELARRIRTLLYEDGYTIPGARQAILDAARAESRRGSDAVELPLARAGLKTGKQQPRLGRLRSELKEILGLLSSAPGAVRAGAERASTPQQEVKRPELFD